jgi:hypothetical protein
MKRSSQIIPSSLAAIVLALLVSSCGSSSRTTVSGYSDEMLNGKRIFVLLPKPEEIMMNNSAAYAYSRGVATDGAREMLAGEIRTQLIQALSSRLDSNTVLNYQGEAVGAMIPLSASDDFTAGTPKSWDALTKAAHTGNFDYMIVLNPISFSNTPSTTGGRGGEDVEMSYSLLDLNEKKVMTTGTVTVDQSELSEPAATYNQLALELTRKLPFYVPATR